jgi:SmpA / OmlA family
MREMTNDECPMTKEIQTNEKRPPSFRAKSRNPATKPMVISPDPSTVLRCARDDNSSFGLHHSFVIRHLSFVVSHASRLLLVLVLALGVSCTPSKRITKANVDAVEQGMSKKQVESILGTPTSITNEQNMKQTTYVYQQGQDSVTIVFIDDKLQSKESTLSN